MTPITPTQAAQDEREYRIIQLPNDLSCLLIHDPETDKAAAAMDVEVGQLSDPTDLPGLAHFLEHMLFLGTEKYPDENSYAKYLNDHGGSSNAYTALENTNYHFNVTHEHLEGALDRFAQFFIAPLFTASATDREIQAVNNEDAANRLNDSWRLHQFTRTLSDPDHPFSKFGTGNLVTLSEEPKRKGIDTRENLLAFHKKYYSSNVMKLVILGKDSLDTLEKWAVEKFSAIPNKGNERLTFSADYFGKNLQMHYIVPVKDLRSLHIIWPLPQVREHYRCKPTHVLSHLLGHEAEGSILQLLKTKGWATGLSAGLHQDTSAFGAFGVTVDLSEEGLDHVKDIVQITFQYLALLQTVDDETWKWIFQEVSDVSAMNFRFKSKERPFNYTRSLACALHKYPPAAVLCGPWLYEDFDLPVIKSVLDILCAPVFRCHVVSQSCKDKADLVEPWYQTAYYTEDVDADLVKHISNCTLHPELALPARNEFIATDFALHYKGKIAKTRQEKTVPERLKLAAAPAMECWFKQDDTYERPTGNVILKIITPVAYETPRASVLTQLYTKLLEDSLVCYAYYADIAGLSYSLDRNQSGLQLVVRGYNHKLGTLLCKILERIKTLEIDPAMFALIKDSMTRSLSNFDKEQPYQHAIYMQMLSTYKLFFHDKEKLKAIQDLTPDDVKGHMTRLLGSGANLEVLIHGNFLPEDATRIATEVHTTLGMESLFDSEVPVQRIVQLLPGHEYLIQAPEPNLEDKNSALVMHFQIGEGTVAIDARLSLLAQLIKEHAFNQLRTNEQLGYLVFSGTQEASGVMGLRFIIQSSVHSADYLYHRVEAYLERYFLPYLQEMTAENFQTNLDAVTAQKEEKEQTINKETNRHWAEIKSHRYQFNRVLEVVEELKKLTQETLLAFFDHFIRAGGHRRLLNIQVFGNLHTVPEPTEEGLANSVRRASALAATGGQPENKPDEEGEGEAKKEVGEVKPLLTSEGTRARPTIVRVENLQFARFKRTQALFPDFEAPH